jgi:hypothetical protein
MLENYNYTNDFVKVYPVILYITLLNKIEYFVAKTESQKYADL